MDAQIVLLLSVNNGDFFISKHQCALVTYLSTAFSIEGCFIEYDLVLRLVFDLHCSVFDHLGVIYLEGIIAYEFDFLCFRDGRPVTHFFFCIGSRAFLLLLERLFKALLVYCPPFFCCD